MYYNPTEAGIRIQKLRREIGVTQAQLSEELGISLDHLKRVESGSRGCSVDMLVSLSQHFEVSLDYLILGKEHRKLPSKQEVQRMIDSLTALKDCLK